MSAQECRDAALGQNCSYSPQLRYFTCTEGALGEACQGHDACASGLVCAKILGSDLYGEVTFCSQCGDDEPCAMTDETTLCSPSIRVGDGLPPFNRCVAPSSVPENQACDAAGSGPQACAKHCVNATYMNTYVGICGECVPDQGHCPALATCIPGVIDATGLVGSTCEAMR
ncbi:MAG: hypothetical protein B7733_22350 [Myxococcales bacterium FL481]|nr:MAG: hypothetical protein B7733_22350 [Myxococcales bacterium FL481]